VIRVLAFAVLLAAHDAKGDEGALAPPLTLDALVREALDRNPDVRIAQRMVEAKRARIGQAGALPDPILMYGVMNEGTPVPFQTLGRNGFSEIYLGLSQDIPYPGKRRLRAEAAHEEAATEKWAAEAVRRRVTADVSRSYYDLYAIHAGLDVVEESRQLLEDLSRVANARFAVGHASQQDVLEVEVEVSRLSERQARLEEQRGIQEARLLRLVFRDARKGVGRPAEVSPTPLTAALEDLLGRAESESPFVHGRERALAQGEKSLELAQRDRRPDFGVNVVYHNRGGLDPYYTIGGTLTLPGLHGRQRKAIEESAANLGAARSGLDAARAEVRLAVTEAYRSARRAERLLQLYDQGILKQDRLSLDSALAQYQVGRVDFLTLITSWRRLLEDQLMFRQELAEHEKALASLSLHVTVNRQAEN